MTTALLCPGQGSQTLGMGKALADAHAVAKEVFQEVDDTLNQKLSAIMWGEDETALTLTANAQPAIMACSVAALRVLQTEGGFDVAQCSYVAGHSLGEYSALVAANSFSLADAAKLLRIRGDAMQAAVPAGQGGMAAIIGPSLEEVEAIAAEAASGGEICDVANDNSPGQVVVSGSAKGIERVIEIAKAKGAKRALPLPVSAPFHSSLMAPAADTMRQALAEATVNAPIIPVVANVTAQAESDADTIRDLLVQQVTGRVRWRESVEWMGANGVTNAIEIGQGNVLAGLVRRINKEIAVTNIGKPEDLDSYAKVA